MFLPTASRDRIITELEHRDLLEVAQMLSVPAGEARAILDQAEDAGPQSSWRWRTGLHSGAPSRADRRPISAGQRS